MRRILTNIVQSTAPLMVMLRYALVAAIIFMGIARLRITLLLLLAPENYQQRDVLQMYLMAKSLMTGMNPYLPLNELSSHFIGPFPYFPHPAPYPPFIAILFIPFSWLTYGQTILAWYVLELIFLAVIAILLVIWWKGKGRILESMVIFTFLLAWFPVMADLEVGQLSILLTLLLLAAMLLMQRKRGILAGVLIGFSAAIKIITWPLILYLVLKKEWRAAGSSILTAAGLNLAALLVMGIKPFMDYYLQVSSQAVEIYHKFWANFSLFTIGYRLFEGTDSAIFATNYHSPALIFSPAIAPYFSIGIVILYLGFSLVWAVRSREVETAFAILTCTMIAISPIVWDHYFVLLLISLVVLLRKFSGQSFSTIQTSFFTLILLLLFLFNERIIPLVIQLNGGNSLLEANHYQFGFASSLIFLLPMLELIGLSVLIWQTEVKKQSVPGEESILPVPSTTRLSK